jgi:hemerythrin-like domain-containing protein
VCDHCGCREYEPIADLTFEHESILALAWDLAESGGASCDLRDELVARLDVHVAKEETWLYPELVASGDLSPVSSSALADEHRSLRATLFSGSFDRRDFYALAAHIEEEELELFPAAMFAFDDAEWARFTRFESALAAVASPTSPG